jgi:hypothetical protein
MRLLRSSLALAVLALAASAPDARASEVKPRAEAVTLSHTPDITPLVTFLRLEAPAYDTVELSKRMQITSNHAGYLVLGWRDARGRTASPFTPERIRDDNVRRSTPATPSTLDSATAWQRQRYQRQTLRHRRLQV